MAKAKTTTATKTAAKIERSPEHLHRMAVGRTIVRSVWLTGYKVEFPEATTEERKLAWKEARKDFTKIGLKALKTLEKTGYKVIEDPDAAQA